jgi:hypothetical protein
MSRISASVAGTEASSRDMSRRPVLAKSGHSARRITCENDSLGCLRARLIRS